MEDTFSIIVPFQKINPYVMECICSCLKLNYNQEKYDILLIPDEKLTKSQLWELIKDRADKKKFEAIVKIILTESTRPGKKRNTAMEQSKAAYFACIDSDAYPHKDWLVNSLPLLKYPKVGIVGGPNSIPHKTTYLERLAIKVLYLHVMSKGLYFLKKFKKDASEQNVMASSNLIVKSKVVKEGCYYDNDYYPCEDAVLCYKVLDKGYTIIYSPDIIVYHHRRPLFLKHLIKIKETAENHANILKKFKNHRRTLHFMPSLFMFFVIFGAIFSFGYNHFLMFYATIILIYFLILLFDCIMSKIYNPVDIFMVSIAAFLTYMFYGYGFLKGTVKNN